MFRSNILVSNLQFLAIPWPDKTFHTIALYIPGFDEESRMLRRSLLRWMNLALILVLRSISSAVKQRFPTLEHVVEAGDKLTLFGDGKIYRNANIQTKSVEIFHHATTVQGLL